MSQEGNNLPTDGEPARVVEGDCLEVLAALPDGIVDAVVTDPPYGLEFMGKEWDRLWDSRRGAEAFKHGDMATVRNKPTYQAGPAAQEWHKRWAEAALRAIKPGGYMLAFGGARTYHRLACAVEDAGFEVRDCLMWVYGTGFPKGKGCLKPAYEPILLCRRPGPKVLPLGIDECRVPTTDKLGGGAETVTRADQKGNEGWVRPWMSDPQARLEHAARVQKNVAKAESLGRWPANVVHDGSGEVLEAFAAFGERKGGGRVKGTEPSAVTDVVYGKFNGRVPYEPIGDSGSAARFFYCAKASKSERGEGNTHPTVKPIALCEWLVRLVCPPGGLVLDPFAGSASVGIACLRAGRRYLGVEKQPEYAEIARRRLESEGAKR